MTSAERAVIDAAVALVDTRRYSLDESAAHKALAAAVDQMKEAGRG